MQYFESRKIFWKTQTVRQKNLLYVSKASSFAFKCLHTKIQNQTPFLDHNFPQINICNEHFVLLYYFSYYNSHFSVLHSSLGLLHFLHNSSNKHSLISY